MSLIDQIIVILYSIAGLVCVVVLVKLLVEACIGNPAGWRERARLKSLKKNLTTVTGKFEAKDFSNAKKDLLGSFHFEIVKNDPEVIEQITSYHHALLQQILLFGKENTLNISSFEVLEDLVLSRTALLRSYYEAELNKKALQKKGGKKVPAWALEEYSKKSSDLKEKLETNQKSIVLQFEKSITAASRSAASEDIVYH